jgi:hypothetical protein
MPVEYLFEVIEEEHFREKIDSYRTKYNRIDDVHASITGALGRDPYLGDIIEHNPGEPEVRVFHSTGLGETPGFWVLYEINKERGQINLLSIHPIPEAKPD